MVKKTIARIIATLVLSTSVLGFSGQVVSAVELNTIATEVKSVIEDGKYTLKNDVEYFKDGASEEDIAHGQASARSILNDKTSIEVKDGVIKMTLKFNKGMYSFIENLRVSKDGVGIDITEDSSTQSATFEIDSLDSKLQIDMGITVMKNDVSFYLFHDKTTLEKVDDVEDGEVDGSTGTVPSVPGDSTDDSNGESGSDEETVIKSKTYTIENDITDTSADGMYMARQYLNKVSKVEEINGNYFVTLTFTGAKLMSQHQVFVNGVKAEQTVSSVSDNSVAVRFPVSSIEDKLKVSVYITMMSRNVEFGVDLLEDTLTLVSESTDEDNSQGDNSDSSTGGNVSGSTGGSTSGTTGGANGNNQNTTIENEVKDEVQIVVGKLYSIQNAIIHESETGKAMARKYLNSTSKVEEINGTYYVTLTFTGSEFMKNHSVTVNGKSVYAYKSVNGDQTTVRFAVSSLSDSIKVKTFIDPMNRDVEFGVQLLTDTLTFIKEYKIEQLPQTGGSNIAMLAGLGLMMVGSGTVLIRKRK